MTIYEVKLERSEEIADGTMAFAAKSFMGIEKQCGASLLFRSRQERGFVGRQ